MLVGLAIGQAGLIAWLVHGRMADKDQAADARVGQVATEAESERTAYELDVTQKALAAANKRCDALEEIIADEINGNPNADLGRTDVRGRLLRIAGRWREAASARSPLPATAGEGVPPSGATEGASAAALPGAVAPDL